MCINASRSLAFFDNRWTRPEEKGRLPPAGVLFVSRQGKLRRGREELHGHQTRMERPPLRGFRGRRRLLSVTDVSMNAINLGWDEVRLPAPVYEGDTLYAQSVVIETRPSRSRPAMGIVKLRTVGFNQDGVTVIEFLRTLMVYRRGHAPEGFRPRREE